MRRDAPYSDGPVGPITVPLEEVEAAQYLEVFLDHDRMVPHGQIERIESPTRSPQLALDDPGLMELAAKYKRRERRTAELIAELDRLRAVVARTIEEHESDLFRPTSVTVFSGDDASVVCIMLPHGQPRDLGSLRRLVKAERRAGRVSDADARIACTRHSVVREVTHDGMTSVFLA